MKKAKKIIGRIIKKMILLSAAINVLFYITKLAIYNIMALTGTIDHLPTWAEIESFFLAFVALGVMIICTAVEEGRKERVEDKEQRHE